MKMTSRIGLALFATLAMTSASFAACVNYPIVTPDNAPVYGAKTIATSGSNANLNGTAWTKATYCPRKLVASGVEGICTGETLSEKVASGNYVDPNFFFGNIGNVPDIERHKNGFYIPLPGPDLFVPTTGYLPGAC